MSLMVQKSLLFYGPEMKTVYNFFNFFYYVECSCDKPADNFLPTIRRFLRKIPKSFIKLHVSRPKRIFLNFSNGQIYCISDNRGEKVLQKIEKIFAQFFWKICSKVFLKSFPQKYAFFIQKFFRIGKAQSWEPVSKFGKIRKVNGWKSEKVTLNNPFTKNFLVKMFLPGL